MEYGCRAMAQEVWDAGSREWFAASSEGINASASYARIISSLVISVDYTPCVMGIIAMGRATLVDSELTMHTCLVLKVTAGSRRTPPRSSQSRDGKWTTRAVAQHQGDHEEVDGMDR